MLRDYGLGYKYLSLSYFMVKYVEIEETNFFFRKRSSCFSFGLEKLGAFKRRDLKSRVYDWLDPEQTRR